MLPNSLKYIGAAAFYACYGLDTVIIPDAVIRIYSYAFASCRNVRSVVIGHSVKDIDMSSFGSCHNLESLIIGESVEIIDDFAFMNCIKLQGHLKYTEKNQIIVLIAFLIGINYLRLDIGDSIRTIGESVLFWIRNRKIHHWSSIEYIGGVAFYSSSLQEIIINPHHLPLLITIRSSLQPNRMQCLRAGNSKGLYEADTLWKSLPI